MKDEKEFQSPTENKNVNMILNAYYDLFSIKDWKPSLDEVKLWYRRYKRRETYKYKRKKKEENE